MIRYSPLRLVLIAKLNPGLRVFVVPQARSLGATSNLVLGVLEFDLLVSVGCLRWVPLCTLTEVPDYLTSRGFVSRGESLLSVFGLYDRWSYLSLLCPTHLLRYRRFDGTPSVRVGCLGVGGTPSVRVVVPRCG